MSCTPLEPWILDRVGYDPAGDKSPQQSIDRYQLTRLRATVDYVRANSPFYKERLADLRGLDLKSLADIEKLPFTTADDLRQHELGLLCVSQAKVSRVVTLQSSGTTAARKRLHFTSADLELTTDFFHRGMSTLVKPGERVLILMPGDLPGSVGDQLVQALPRMGATGIVQGLVSDPAETLRRIHADRIDVLVGLPIQVLALARHPLATWVRGRLKSILLSADYVPGALVKALKEIWDLPVFNHYGMTEMGLGGGVECDQLCGYHLREADFLWEVIDPESGRPLPPGKSGELVFTTLTREGMPLIRYRSGDRTRFLAEPCPCGSVLQRLGPIEGRYAGDLRLKGGGRLNIADLDEALFPIPELLNYHPFLTEAEHSEQLNLRLQLQGIETPVPAAVIRLRLQLVPAIAMALAAGELEIGSIEPGPMPIASGTIKRRIEDLRKEQA
jgi:phenylacetate-coenzyme A ligase PaaK-like adenylate-forming protein